MIVTAIHIVLTGILLILLGWLLYRNPNWINPYGEMPPERKALVNIDGLKKALFIALGICGGVLVAAALLLLMEAVGPSALGIILGVNVLAFVVAVIVAMRRYNGFARDENDEGYYHFGNLTKAAKVTVVIVMVLVAALAVFFTVIMNRK